jgi:histidinol-phosphate aminotransferase
MSISQLARADVRALPLYAPDVADCAIDVSDNTNLWGASPAAQRALLALSVPVARYPSLYSAPLREAILRYAGLEAGAGLNVVTGCGSDDVLDSAMRAFGVAGSRIAFPTPTFSMIPTFARLNGLDRVGVPLTDAFDVDAERLVECQAAITYLCTPNNPTATGLSRAATYSTAAHARGVVIIDEAYAEFAPEVFVDLVMRHERVLVARTFSKAFGLAGLRIGYGIASDEMIGLVARARGPYKVNAFAERAALASLAESDDALGWVRQHAVLAIAVRERLSRELRQRGFLPLPSIANFVFVPTARAQTLASRLRGRGILVRVVSGLPNEIASFAAEGRMGLRIGVGPWPAMQTLLDTLDEVMT